MIRKQLSIILALAIVFLLAIPVQAARTGGGSVNYFANNNDGFSTIYYTGGPVSVGSSASLLASFFVQGFSNLNIPIFSVATSTGQSVFQIPATGSTTKMINYSGFAAPTVSTSTGSGSVMGTTTVASGSTDLAGSVYLITGSVPVVNSTIFNLTFASSTAPAFCIVQPMNAITSAGTASTTFVATSTTGFSLKSNATGLTSTTTYQWAYHCN